ncbi:MAG: single-stranded DNA-binding protein [Flavobacteriales bacterium]
MNTMRNRVTLIGHLGKNPELTTFENGNKKASFTLATNSSYKTQSGEKKEETQWHNVVFYGRSAEIAVEFLSKGREVAVEGRLSTRNYDDEKGVRRYVTEVIGNELVLLSSKTPKVQTESA